MITITMIIIVIISGNSSMVNIIDVTIVIFSTFTTILIYYNSYSLSLSSLSLLLVPLLSLILSLLSYCLIITISSSSTRFTRSRILIILIPPSVRSIVLILLWLFVIINVFIISRGRICTSTHILLLANLQKINYIRLHYRESWVRSTKDDKSFSPKISFSDYVIAISRGPPSTSRLSRERYSERNSFNSLRFATRDLLREPPYISRISFSCCSWRWLSTFG